MIALKHLESYYPKEIAGSHFTYLKNKHKGGINNSKGNNFENFFAVFQIAKLFNSGVDKKSTFFSGQTFSFVDDLFIEVNYKKGKRQRRKCKKYFYQIKDIQTLSKSTKLSIKKDFNIQSRISSSVGHLGFVVSNVALIDSFKKELSYREKKIIKFLHFNTATSINTLLQINSDFKNELIKMCAINNPSSDKLDTLGTIILGVWDSTDKSKISLDEILSKCYNLNPHFIKGFENKISDYLHNVLDMVIGFSYKLEGGFITWEYEETDKGTVPYAIGTPDFLQWENDLVNLGGTNDFNIIEPYLN